MEEYEVTAEEANELADEAKTNAESYRAMTYQQGIADAIDWLLGNGDRPL